MTAAGSSTDAVARKAIRGAFALGTRQIFVHGLNILGSIALARILTPAEFGVYVVILLYLGFLMLFGDGGLGASLIRQPTEPTVEDYRAVFTAQQIVLATLVLAIWLAVSQAARFGLGLSHEGALLVAFASLALVFTSFEVLPCIRLERDLAFNRLARVEVCEAVVFNAVAVLLAWMGYGVVALVLAVVLRSLTGAVVANLVAPWPIGWRLDWPRVRGRLAFGIPYQGISITSMAKDSFTPIVVGVLLGAASVGYIGWAQMVAAYPLLLIMILQRLYMPTFARVQDDPEALGRFVEHAIRILNVVAAPLAVLTLALIAPGTAILFGEQWLVAIPLFYLIWTANLFVPTVQPLFGLLNALGRSGTAFAFALLWAVATWVLGIPLVLAFGAFGFAMAYALVQITNFALIAVARRLAHFHVLRAAAPAWGAAFLAGGLVHVAVLIHTPQNLLSLVAYGLAGLVVYAALAFALQPTLTRQAWSWWWRTDDTQDQRSHQHAQ